MNGFLEGTLPLPVLTSFASYTLVLSVFFNQSFFGNLNLNIKLINKDIILKKKNNLTPKFSLAAIKEF